MSEPKAHKENGFAIRNLHDVGVLAAIIAPILTVLVGTILWGLKLEQELNTEREISARERSALQSQITNLREDVAEVKTQVGEGILPIAEVEIQNLRRDQERHEREEH